MKMVKRREEDGEGRWNCANNSKETLRTTFLVKFRVPRRLGRVGNNRNGLGLKKIKFSTQVCRIGLPDRHLATNWQRPNQHCNKAIMNPVQILASSALPWDFQSLGPDPKTPKTTWFLKIKQFIDISTIKSHNQLKIVLISTKPQSTLFYHKRGIKACN